MTNPLHPTNIPARHHWWPECHSNLWVNDEGLINSISKDGRVVRAPPSKTAVIKHHNTVRLPDGSADVSLELYFANEIESPVAPILNRLATEKDRNFQWEQRLDRDFAQREARNIRKDGFLPVKYGYCVQLMPSERMAVARYIASLLVRVPSYKDKLKSEQMVSDISQILAINEEEARFETDLLHVEIVRRHLDDYANRLLGCAWMLIETHQQEMIFSDTPVVPSALGWGDAEAICPITPNRCIMFVKGFRAPIADSLIIVEARPTAVRALNQTLLQNSERFVFSRSPYPVDFAIRHLGSRQARIVPSVGPNAKGPDTGPMLRQ